MISGFAKSCWDSLKIRAVSPLFGAFIISWAVWNYRIIVVLLTQGNYVQKFDYIDSHLVRNWADGYLWGFLGPLVTALAIIYIYPFPARLAYEYALKRQVHLNKRKQEIEGLELLTRDKQQEFLRRMVEREAKMRELLEESDNRAAKAEQMLKDVQFRPSAEAEQKFQATLMQREKEIGNKEETIATLRAEISSVKNLLTKDKGTMDVLEKKANDAAVAKAKAEEKALAAEKMREELQAVRNELVKAQQVAGRQSEAVQVMEKKLAASSLQVEQLKEVEKRASEQEKALRKYKDKEVVVEKEKIEILAKIARVGRIDRAQICPPKIAYEERVKKEHLLDVLEAGGLMHVSAVAGGPFLSLTAKGRAALVSSGILEMRPEAALPGSA